MESFDNAEILSPLHTVQSTLNIQNIIVSPVRTICMICQQRILINITIQEPLNTEAFDYNETENNTLVKTIVCKPCNVCNYYVHKDCWTEYIRNKQIHHQPINCLTVSSHILNNIIADIHI